MAIPRTFPQRFGKYVLLAPLAKGGMGELYLAYSGQSELKKLCVIKTILAHLADEDFVSRFVTEAKIVVKLSHGNLVPVFEAGEVDHQFFVAMEYIEGKDLRDLWHRLMETKRRCPPEIAVYLMREICRGLSYVHSFEGLDLVHRDVSPPNVLLSYTGEVRLTDFGVATSTLKLQKTAPGILLGKLSYMSPEQARNDLVDARADIYSVGIILWELLTGQRLFPAGSSLLERYQRAINPSMITPPSATDVNIPPSMDLIVLRSLAPDVGSRYADAETLRRDLAAILAKIGPTTDASSVQALLKDLYGSEMEKEREERRQLLESMASEVQGLMEEYRSPSSIERAVTRPLSEKGALKVAFDLAGVDEESEEDEESGSSARLPAGTMIGGRYRIVRLIGEGGMGTVYEANHVDIDKHVAVKVLHPIYSRMPDVVSRFRQEARAASRIGHPNIVEVYDAGTTDDGCLYFVMEQLSGIDLADVLDRERRLSIPRSIRIATQIGEAVAAAHEAGIIHRDLKPENIFLTIREGAPDFVKVLDFGIAQSTSVDESKRQRLTHPGMAMGTPEYMAPEQAAGKATDHRVDVYAVGALIYEMIVGEPPHAGANIMEVLNRKATQPVVPPRQLREGIPLELEQLILSALADDPAERPQTMSQMCYELNKMTRGRAGAVASLLGIPTLSSPATPSMVPASTAKVPAYDPVLPTKNVVLTKRKKKWLIVPGIGLLVVIVLGVIVFGRATTTSHQRQLGSRSDAAPRMLVRTIPKVDGSVVTTVAKDSGLGSAMQVDLGEQAATDLADAAQEKDATTARKSRPTRPAGRHSVVTFLAAGRQHLLNGRFAAARLAFEAALRSPRHRGQALLGLAEVEFQLGDYPAAERKAQRAIKEKAGLRAKLVLGNIYFKLRKYKQAEQLYQAVLAVEKNHKEAQRNLAAAKRRLNP